MHIYLTTIQVSLIFFLFLVPLSILPFVIYHYKKYGHVGGKRAMVIYAFVFYAMTAFLMTILPLPGPLPKGSENFYALRQIKIGPNFEFFRFVKEIFKELKGHITLAGVLKSRTFMVTVFNILLLLPLGFFLRYLFRMRFWKVLVLGFATSLFFEITQLTGIYGLYTPYRLFEVDDLMTNTFGVILGFWLFDYVKFLPSVETRKIKLQKDANLTQRFLLFSVDYLIISYVAENFIIPNRAGFLEHLLWSLGIYFAYFVLLPRTRLKNTLAGKFFGLKVVRESETPASFKSVFVLYGILLFTPMVISHVTRYLVANTRSNGIYAIFGLVLSLLWGIFTFGMILLRKDKRSLHNILSRTKVISLITE